MRTILTGASRGIGQAIAERLARPGAALALCASKPSSDLDRVAEFCRNRGAVVATLTGDLADRDIPADLVRRAADALGGLDAVVANAGIVVSGALATLAAEGWDQAFAVNVRSPWLLAQAAYPHLQASRGAVVAIASMSGVEPYPGTGAYSPTKAALIMLVRTLAQEWAGDGIRVNAISPGLFRSALTAPIYADPARAAAREALVPLHRIGDPARELAGAVDFLLSTDAAYVTGQNLVVDGGLLGSIQTHLAGRPQSVRP